MHEFIINVSLQLLPVAGKKHPYIWVDEVIEIIKKSKLKSEVGAFATVVEGTYNDVMQLIDSINKYLLEHKCEEWILAVQFHIRSEKDMTADEKTLKHK